MPNRFGLVAILASRLLARPVSALRSCEQLRDLALAHTTITAAAAVPEGSVRATMGPAQVAPAHCAVQGVTRPTKDSEIRFELWLPVSG